MADFEAQIARPGMQHDAKLSLIVRLQFDEMVAAAERADLIGGIVQFLHQFLRHRVLFLGCHSLKEAGDRFTLLFFLMVLEAGRDIPQDVARDRLGQLPVRRLDFDQPFDRDVRLDKTHPAADIHPDRIRNDDLFGSDDAPDRHAVAGMRIRHQYNPLMQKR